MSLMSRKEVVQTVQALRCGVCECAPTPEHVAELSGWILGMPRKMRGSTVTIRWFCPEHRKEGRRILDAEDAKRRN